MPQVPIAQAMSAVFSALLCLAIRRLMLPRWPPKPHAFGFNATKTSQW